MFSPYSKEIMKHFKNPKNMGRIKNASAIGEAGNLVCGDIMKLYLKIGENKKGEKMIKDIKFETFGCIVAIANTSMLTTMVKGKTLEEVSRITREELIKKLGKPLPPIKIHCSILALDALHEAIYKYYLKSKLPISDELEREHERIQKTLNTIEHKLNTIEHKHEEFVEMEEKILKK
jgi:nitrogen fixation NifU-like protein